jgi:cbb3-type cytochrome oxidase cytochrome c subunit/mono/diheme cytochrome c family protein
MAATDKTYRNQKTLDIVFAVSCILMLFSVVWMFYQDYAREFKTVQRDFRDVETALNERMMLEQLPDENEVDTRIKAVESARQAADAIKSNPDFAAYQRGLFATRDTLQASYQGTKADFDSRSSYYDIDVEHLGKAEKNSSTYRSLEKKIAARKEDLQRLKSEMDATQRRIDENDAKIRGDLPTLPGSPSEADKSAYSKYREQRKALDGKEKQRADTEDELKKMTAAFDRFAKATAQKNWKVGDWFRNLPIIDGFASPTRINQIVLNDLTIDYSFRDVPRYDRCTTCHLAIDRAVFSRDALEGLCKSADDFKKDLDPILVEQQALKAQINVLKKENDQLQPLIDKDKDERDKLEEDIDKDREAKKEDPKKKQKLEELKKRIADNEKKIPANNKRREELLARAQQLDDPIAQINKKRDRSLGLKGKLTKARQILEERVNKGESLGFDIQDLPQKVRYLNLTDGQITQFAAHPRLDLFVDSNSAHPAEKVGCTICHNGQGSATEFNLATHVPADARQKEEWHKKYKWESTHFWDYPMFSSRFIESTCLKCHHEVTDLVRHGSKEEAPKLLRGYNLVRENGCFGCHEIAGIKGNRPVGPDLRLEPAPALEWLSAADQDRAKADPSNPPGTMRKVGPSLRRIAEKTDQKWTRRWLESPRGFREDTKMPHFYNLSTNSEEALNGTGQEKFPAAEIHSIAYYLFEESKLSLDGKDTYRQALIKNLNTLHSELLGKDKNGPRPLGEKDKKELDAATRQLADLALLSAPARSAQINTTWLQLKNTQERLQELARKKELSRNPQPGAVPVEFNEQDQQEVKDRGAELADKTADLVKEALPEPLKNRLVNYDGAEVTLPAREMDPAKLAATGGRLFKEKGCLACHSHDGTTTGDKKKAVESLANFAPNLTRVAAKLTAEIGGPDGGRRWLVQWLMNPTIHHPRTRMPITQLAPADAISIADWLLSHTVPDWGVNDPAEPTMQTLIALARVYLAKAPGMTRKDVDDYLPEGEKAPAGIAESDPHVPFMVRDAEERALVTDGKKPLTADRLKWYIAKKSITRLGCFGCHDLPGFELSKPIGTALNDWGKKDGDRLAFEDADAYVRGHFNLVEARDDPKNKLKADREWKFDDGKAPYEKHFYEALEHHSRDGFLHLKLSEPRSFDYNRLRAWDDRLRMPQFQFARSRKHPGETESEYQVRQTREEAEAREAVMTFILGLVAEPVPLKHVHNPKPDKLAEIKGRQVLEKFNCYGCHQIRPGVYEFKPTRESIQQLEGAYAKAAEKFATDHSFMGHNAWVGSSSPFPDRMIAFGTEPKRYAAASPEEPATEEIRLTEALRFTGKDGVVRDIPAGNSARFMAADIIKQSDSFGGVFAGLMVPYLLGNPDYSQLVANDPGKARDRLPPPLIREGERVQPNWLYQFVQNPHEIRPQVILRMPKFNMSSEDASAIVNYFSAVEKLSNPAAGTTPAFLAVEQHNDAFWERKTADYLKSLGKDDKSREDEIKKRLEKLKPIWQVVLEDQVKQAELNQAAAEKAVARANEASKPNAEADLKRLTEELKAAREKLDKKDFGDLEKQWRTRDAYATEAYRLFLSNNAGGVCLTCHSVGGLGARQGPPLDVLSERLRPDWTGRWIANPAAMFPYTPVMPSNFPRNKLVDQDLFKGQPVQQVMAIRDVLLNFPRIASMPVNRFYRATVPPEEKKQP